MKIEKKYDIIVAGGGHAGIEAANASAKMGCRTALFTLNKKAIGRPSCNPSIGGTAKGHIVKEIDALGGLMSLIADKAGLQFKTLNKSKGPAVWSPRAQIDKDLYPKIALEELLKLHNLDIVNGEVSNLNIINDKIKGVVLSDGSIVLADAVIICAGTFLNGIMFTGMNKTHGGRYGEPPVSKMTEQLNSYSLKSSRLKTGTPPRVFAETVNYDKIKPAPGDVEPIPFSYRTNKVQNRILCYMTQTNEKVHSILRTGFSQSPMFSGIIKGAGPRYCPSIEDKIERFSDRASHKILLEPEGLHTNSVYVNGFSTSLPVDVQLKGLRKIEGLERTNIMRPGYAIEYDFFFPYQLKYTLETKAIEGLYFAGQINGTSGYEEAAGQGLVAGINAAAKLKEIDFLKLDRSESYIGVLIDDLINKSTEEPYRMFTSLAEYRLLLRQDNADLRLMKYGRKYGLIPARIYDKILKFEEKVNEAYKASKKVKIIPENINDYLREIGENPIIEKTDIYTLSKRSKVKLTELIKASKGEDNIKELLNKPRLLEHLQIEIKYEGYISRQKKDIKYFIENENKKIPVNFDYINISSLSNEAREKLDKIKPDSLGQASRISGVSAADISVLSLYLK